MTDFIKRLDEAADRVTVALDALIPRADGPEAQLISAMRYAALGPGKRIRPFIAIECGRLAGAEERGLLRAGAAIECVHAYSLVHDDLPCMDNDDIRRGRPTVHRAYDEATAVLAGDALLTLAFEILADSDTHHSARIRNELVTRLAQAAGARGMVGGQMLDMSAPGEDWDIHMVARMQRMKTGALIGFAAESGAILASADAPVRKAILAYSHDVGLAFQIVDDILDASGQSDKLGKAAGKDAGQGKATFVSILGMDEAKAHARRVAAQAKSHLEPFGQHANILHEAADYVLARGT
ncbi:MAG: polyprenyl synthetase family protein [Maricaulaceae bacterium]|nr:polyprenyl synthetase family protein [Maricaulaceae bacterium]